MRLAAIDWGGLAPWAQFSVAFLLGGAGWATVYRLIVRPRVAYGVRTQRTIRIRGRSYQSEAEEALQRAGIPVAFSEVEWWNRGLRTAESVAIEVRATAEITRWDLTPAQEDISGPWECSSDPASSADPQVLRIHQSALRPGARFQLVLGIALPEGEDDPLVRAYHGDRAIKPWQSAWLTPALLTLLIVGVLVPLVAYGVLGLVVGGTFSLSPPPKEKASTYLLVMFLVGVLAGLLVPKMLSILGPGWPTWVFRWKRRRSGLQSH